MTAHINPLLIAIKRYADEALFSFLIRLATANFYHPPQLLISHILTMLEAVDIQDRLWRPTHATTYAILASLTRTSRAEIQYALPPLYMEVRSYEAVVFCPICLGEAYYYRVHWMPTLSAICTVHQCWLVDRCNGCRKKISIRAFIAGQCHHCRKPFTDIPVSALAEDAIGIQAQYLLHSWAQHQSFISPDYQLPVSCPEALCETIYHVQYILAEINATRIGQNWWYPRRTFGNEHNYHLWDQGVSDELVSIYATTATSMNILMGWPREFHNFLAAIELLAWDDYFGFPDDKIIAWLFDRLRRLVAIYPWVSQAYDAYFTQRNIPVLALNRSLRYSAYNYLKTQSQAIPAQYAMNILKLSKITFDDLLQHGVLRPWVGPPQLFVSFQEVRALQAVIQTAVSLDEVQDILKVSVEEVQLLISTEVLPLMPNPARKIRAWISIWSILMCLEHCEPQPCSWNYDDSPWLRGIMYKIGTDAQVIRAWVCSTFIGQYLS